MLGFGKYYYYYYYYNNETHMHVHVAEREWSVKGRRAQRKAGSFKKTSSSFAHLLRHLPPTATADPQRPLQPLAFPPAYPAAAVLSFAHHLRRLALDALARCLNP